jgi:hypothetical protein
LVKPNSRIEAAICATCWSLCVRAFLPLGCDAYPDAAFICSKPSLAK